MIIDVIVSLSMFLISFAAVLCICGLFSESAWNIGTTIFLIGVAPLVALIFIGTLLNLIVAIGGLFN